MSNRNLNPHAEALMAMSLWGDQYSGQLGGCMDFYDSRSRAEKKTCVDLVSKILSTHRADGTPPQSTPPVHLMGLTADQLCTTPLIEDLVPTNEEWEACEVVKDRYELMKRRVRLAFARAATTEGSPPSPNLTVADIETLKACDDWKATFEVIAIRRLPSSADSYRAAQQHIDALLERGLLEFGKPNTTYRATAAGRAALATTEGQNNG